MERSAKTLDVVLPQPRGVEGPLPGVASPTQPRPTPDFLVFPTAAFLRHPRLRSVQLFRLRSV